MTLWQFIIQIQVWLYNTLSTGRIDSNELSLKPQAYQGEFAFLKVTTDFLDFSSLDEYVNSQRSDLSSFGAMANKVGQFKTDTVGINAVYFVLYSDEFSGLQKYVIYDNMIWLFCRSQSIWHLFTNSWTNDLWY